jgi:hypothetical protein
METSAPIQYIPNQEKSFSLKEALGYTLITGLGIGAIIYFGGRRIKQKKTDKADSQSFKVGTAEYKAKEIKMFFENDNSFSVGTDFEKLRHLLTQVSSQEEMDKIKSAYFLQNRSVLDNDLKKELQSTQFIELSQIIAAKPKKAGQKVSGDILYKSWAIRLKAAFDKTYGFVPGTDEKAIQSVFDEIPTQRAFVNVGVAYYKEYKRKLMEDLKDELSTSEYYSFMKQLTDKPKA